MFCSPGYAIALLHRSEGCSLLGSDEMTAMSSTSSSHRGMAASLSMSGPRSRDTSGVARCVNRHTQQCWHLASASVSFRSLRFPEASAPRRSTKWSRPSTCPRSRPGQPVRMRRLSPSPPTYRWMPPHRGNGSLTGFRPRSELGHVTLPRG